MPFPSYRDEMMKIARASQPGQISMERLRQMEDEERRQDFLQVGRPSAYPKALIGGAVAGAGLPTLMTVLPHLSPEATAGEMDRAVLSAFLEKALTENKDFRKSVVGKADLSKERIQSLARDSARHYYKHPEVLRNAGLSTVLRNARTEYRDPRSGPAWVLDAVDGRGNPTILARDFTAIAEQAGRSKPPRMGDKIILSNRDVERFLDVKNQMMAARHVDVSVQPHLGVQYVPDAKFEGIPNLPTSADDPIEDLALKAVHARRNRLRREVPTDLRGRAPSRAEQLVEEANLLRNLKRDLKGLPTELRGYLKPFEYPDVVGTAVPQPHSIEEVLRAIKSRHGAPDLPSPTSLTVRNALRAVKKNKVGIGVSAGIGAFLSAGNVHRKRKELERLRKASR